MKNQQRPATSSGFKVITIIEQSTFNTVLTFLRFDEISTINKINFLNQFCKNSKKSGHTMYTGIYIFIYIHIYCEIRISYRREIALLFNSVFENFFLSITFLKYKCCEIIF